MRPAPAAPVMIELARHRTIGKLEPSIDPAGRLQEDRDSDALSHQLFTLEIIQPASNTSGNLTLVANHGRPPLHAEY